MSAVSMYVFYCFGVSIQGVRTADANTAQWMIPDPFGGFITNLMSQQPYIWNGDSPMLNEDPSGYCFSDETICVKAPRLPPIDDGIGGEDLGNILTATGGSDLVGGPIMFPFGAIVGNQKVFAQLCAHALGSGGCFLIDGCGDMIASGGLSGGFNLDTGKFSRLGASASLVVGYALPFPGHSAYDIYTGASGSMSNFAPGGGGAMWNFGGIAPFAGVGVPGFGASITEGVPLNRGKTPCKRKGK